MIFTSDNGGERYSFNWPFSFQKLYLYEGGIRVPAIVRWPGVVPAGAVTEQAAITMDWTATILAAAGAQARRAPARRREPDARAARRARGVRPRAVLAHAHAGRRARRPLEVRAGRRRGALYDLGVDLGEKTDLKARETAAFAKQKSRYSAWAAQMLPRPT